MSLLRKSGFIDNYKHHFFTPLIQKNRLNRDLKSINANNINNMWCFLQKNLITLFLMSRGFFNFFHVILSLGTGFVHEGVKQGRGFLMGL